jgi:hypothetical protein
VNVCPASRFFICTEANRGNRGQLFRYFPGAIPALAVLTANVECTGPALTGTAGGSPASVAATPSAGPGPLPHRDRGSLIRFYGRLNTKPNNDKTFTTKLKKTFLPQVPLLRKNF